MSGSRRQHPASGRWVIAREPAVHAYLFDDFRVVIAGITGGHRVTTGRQVPFCMFTDPELARVGLSEAEAGAKELPIDWRNPDGDRSAHANPLRNSGLHEGANRHCE